MRDREPCFHQADLPAIDTKKLRGITHMVDRAYRGWLRRRGLQDQEHPLRRMW